MLKIITRRNTLVIKTFFLEKFFVSTAFPLFTKFPSDSLSPVIIGWSVPPANGVSKPDKSETDTFTRITRRIDANGQKGSNFSPISLR